MNSTILILTFLVELCLGLVGFIAIHLRAEARRRRLAKLPKWDMVPYSFGIDWYSRGSDGKRGGVTSIKSKKPHSRRV